MTRWQIVKQIGLALLRLMRGRGIDLQEPPE